MTLNMIAVGDGSCFVVRIPQPGRRDFVVMFDCGSLQFMEVGRQSVVPALRELGVRQIDLLLISHADLDHFNGMIDVADAMPVHRVISTPQLVREAAERPDGATQMLVRLLRQHGLTIEEVTRGWEMDVGDAQLSMLWPPADFFPRWANDASLVLAIEVAGRRVLLNGDIQQLSKTMLMDDATIDLRADITDLPHHGSYVEASERWLRRVEPTIVLQSSGPQRLYRDRWAHVFADSPMHRLVTEWQGMCEVRIAHDGEITWSAVYPLGRSTNVAR